ncbi:conserved domain-containing protein [Nakamurella panacisegetis]|uniref:Conserved domain-containing protein n=1 Tax=Nakamurella panacisegetis TaxID=1090615 RepID=A0A1H0RFB2_9ACTN|nr:PRC and DUF2382 domain-containing protein [Nakamurella panacisegetis]SDP28237.1 conserved domain-containing protein [Nakamurella panacisegetis]
MTYAQGPEAYVGKTAVDPQGDKIGSVGEVYVNDESGQPDWITVNTGLFGMKENFAPLRGSTFDGDNLVLPFDKSVVKDAPDVPDSSHLDPDEQQSLYSYYGQYLGGAAGTYAETGTNNEYARGNTRGAHGYDTSGPTTDEAMTRSEEHLNVGTQQVEAGRARLRKYVVTEQQTVSVPVSHEEVRIEREPITDASRGDAVDGPAISEEEHEVVLHAEQPVISTEAVPVERVKIGTETVTENQNVSGEVRKEQVEVEDGTTTVDPDARTQNR